MPESITINGPEFHIRSDPDRRGGEMQARRPFRMAVLGDFSGQAQRGPEKPGPCMQVDRDNLDEVMRRLDVRLALPLSDPDAPPEVLRFRSLEDFHPDRIYERFPIFRVFHEARKKANDPAAFTAALEPSASEPRPVESAPMPLIHPGHGLLDDVIDRTGTGRNDPVAAPRADSPLQTFLQDVVSPHSMPNTSRQRAQVIAGLDAAAADYMRAILRYPAFQDLESIWRALAFLVFRTQTDENLQLHIMDIGREALARDLGGPKDLRETELYRHLVSETVETPGASTWSVLLGAFTFGPAPEDAAVLRHMGQLARLSGAPFICGAGQQILGCSSLADSPDPSNWHSEGSAGPSSDWHNLRRTPGASWIGLALPRFLLRLPYGADTRPIDHFEFEEFSGPPSHEAYVWGNPAFACAYLLAAAFSRNGWKFRPGDVREIDRLPLHSYREAGEARLKPCAEILLTEHAAELILASGPMPLLSFKDRDTIRLARFQSIADPPTALAGPWNRE